MKVAGRLPPHRAQGAMFSDYNRFVYLNDLNREPQLGVKAVIIAESLDTTAEIIPPEEDEKEAFEAQEEALEEVSEEANEEGSEAEGR